MLFNAAITSGYPAPIVNMSFWIACVPNMLFAGKAFDADFISLAFIASGVMVGPNFWTRRAAAPDTIGAATHVPLSTTYSKHWEHVVSLSANSDDKIPYS